MDTIAVLKEQNPAPTPLIVFRLQLPDASVEHWSTHRVTIAGTEYTPRIVRHSVFNSALASEFGGETSPTVRFSASNVDGHIVQLSQSTGFRGAVLTASFVFYSFDTLAPSIDQIVLFRGTLDAPTSLTEDTVHFTAVSRLNLRDVQIPSTRIQRRCPWEFPATALQRAEALDGGTETRRSPFYPCGYSADQPGGHGNLDGGEAFTTCRKTRGDCIERGMFDSDAAGRATRRFGGIQYLPPSILVRSHDSKRPVASEPTTNEAKYDDAVPIAYGTVWLTPPVVFSRADGNLTRLEVILGSGKTTAVHKVVVNDVEVPHGRSGQDMTATGWWNLFAAGDRTGGFNLNFTDTSSNPVGDPYGSMAALSIVVPNQIDSGGSIPKVAVLVSGSETEQFDADGSSLGWSSVGNPSWILLDVLRRSGWLLSELDIPSFAAAAAVCDELIPSYDNNGNALQIPRFRCNLLLAKRRTAADVLRGIQNNSRLHLHYDTDGLLAVGVENAIALQHPLMPLGSNAASSVNGGWPAYCYSDGSDGVPANILRTDNGTSSLRIWSRSGSEVPNRVSVEFADEHNEYQQDSLVVTDSEDILTSGREVEFRLLVEGLPNYDQAVRVLRNFLDRSIEGNLYVEFETSTQALLQRPGDIITLSSLRDGFVAQQFRILRISPTTDFVSAKITAQLHSDSWFQDVSGVTLLTDGRDRQQTLAAGRPSSLVGNESDSDGFEIFGIQENSTPSGVGTVLTELSVSFRPPTIGTSTTIGVPILSLTPTVLEGSGTLEGGQHLYYSVSGVDADGHESQISFVVRAELGPEPAYAVQLTGLSFSSGTVAFHVYRGDSPSTLRSIAREVPLASEFVDAGETAAIVGTPDPHFDHANFYWRFENQDEVFADAFSATSIGSSVLSLPVDGLAGHVVRITRGLGRGQERIVASNDETSVEVTRAWDVVPDLSSAFVLADNTWQFGGSAKTSPARFVVPSLHGRVIQVSGRAADARNVESTRAGEIVTRYRLGGGALGIADTDVPPQPFFAVTALRDGNLELSGIGFLELQNTQTVSTGTLVLTYIDELAQPSPHSLEASCDVLADSVSVVPPMGVGEGEFIQIDSEVMQVTGVAAAGGSLSVERGVCGTTAEDHTAGSVITTLQRRVVVVAFERSIFGTTSGAEWSAREWMPNVKIICAELWLTNLFGTGPISQIAFTNLADGGLRTFRGGQYSLQVPGTVAILADATPPVEVQTSTSVRDVHARLREAPTGGDVVARVTVDGTPWADLTIPVGQTTSAPIDGSGLLALPANAVLGLDITSVGLDFPGSDLAVTVRL